MPSRLDSYFLFEDKGSAEYYIKEHRANDENIKIVMAEPLKIIYEKTFDMAIWDEDNTRAFYSSCEKQMIRYWLAKRNKLFLKFYFKENSGFLNEFLIECCKK